MEQHEEERERWNWKTGKAEELRRQDTKWNKTQRGQTRGRRRKMKRGTRRRKMGER